MRIKSDHYKGWDTANHLETFGLWNRMTPYHFSKAYGCFEENRYILDAVASHHNSFNCHPSILDVGCATGTLYKHLKQNLAPSKINYKGIDLSSHAIDAASLLHGDSLFEVVNEDWHKTHESADIVYSRDTIMHQQDPYLFLENLLKLTNNCLITRLRTRDLGDTVFDTQKSCQAHYSDFWMPYIVLNFDELIDFFKSFNEVSSVTINRSYEILGGHNLRNLPKELFFEKAGGAETSLMVMIDRGANNKNFQLNTTFNLEGHNYMRSKKLFFRTLGLTSKVLNKIIN